MDYQKRHKKMNLGPIPLRTYEVKQQQSTNEEHVKIVEYFTGLLKKYRDENQWKFQIKDAWQLRPSTELYQQYTFGAIIGKGGDGIIYKEANQNLVIKEISIAQGCDDFNTFAKIAASLQEMRMMKETGIVTLHGLFYDMDKNVIFKIYEQFGADLACLMRDKRPFSEAKTRKIVLTLCRKIELLHDAAFIHGDIKAENVLQGANGNWELIDFDRAKFCQSGTIIDAHFGGTFGWTAPELKHHGGYELNQIDHGVDVWAVALLIIYLINGGDLGMIEVDKALRSKYNQAVKDGNLQLMKEIFKIHYNRLYVDNFGIGYLSEVNRLRDSGKISPMLASLLRKILVKDPIARLSIDEIIADKWFKQDIIENTDADADVEVIFVCRDNDDEKFEIIEEYDGNQYPFSAFDDSLRVSDAYNDSSLIESDYFELLNGSTSFVDELQTHRVSMVEIDNLYAYNHKDDMKEDTLQQISIGLSELF